MRRVHEFFFPARDTARGRIAMASIALASRQRGEGRIWRNIGLVLIAIVSIVSLTACTSGATKESQTNPLTGATTVPSGLESFYAQKVSWGPCAWEGAPEAGECATVEVPVDYQNPQGEKISIALARIKAQGEKLGSLFMNPGGPGSSGVSFVGQAKDILPSDIRQHFDLVGFDPRGVQNSAPIRCLDDGQTDQVRAEDVEIDTDAGRNALRNQMQWWGQQCAEKNGALVSHVDTPSAARDLDILRAAVGDKRLSYLGYSYGTYLGAIYMDLFPQNAGRMVLDGVVDANASMDEVGAAQAVALEKSLRHFVVFCQDGSSCPLKGGVDQGMKQLQNFLDEVEKKPLETTHPERPLTYSLAMSGIVGPLYAESTYPALREALRQAIDHHNGAQLLAIADQYAERSANGHYTSNSQDAFMAINSLDYQVTGDMNSWNADHQKIVKKAPIMGEYMGYSEVQLEAWPVKSTYTRHPISAREASPALIIGNTHDPATPYSMAKKTHQRMKGSKMVSLESWDHTSLLAGSKCVNTRVSDYLVNGKLPDKDIHCNS